MRLKDKGNTKDDESKCLHTHIQNEKGDKGKSKDVNTHTKHDCLIRSNPMDGQMDKQLQQHIPNSSNNKMMWPTHNINQYIFEHAFERQRQYKRR